MKFKIYSTRCDGKELTHVYDNMSNEIYTELGIPVWLDRDPRTQNFVKRYRLRKNDSSEVKTNKLRHLRIQLGLNCNFSCKYCNQRQDRAEYSPISLPYEVLVRQFMKKLDDAKIETNRITLWGGEPLVYIKLLRVLVPQLRNKFPTAKISTLSNGSLITDDIIDFFLKYRIQFSLSHDAYSFNVYRSDDNPLDNPKIINAIQRYIDIAETEGSKIPEFGFSINVVFTPENSNFEKVNAYFEEKFGRPIRWHFEGVAKLNKNTVNIITPYTHETRQELLTSMLRVGSQPIRLEDSPYWFLQDKVSEYLGYIINRIPTESQQYHCDNNRSDIVSMDLNGSILSCHGVNPTTGTIGNIKNLTSIVNTKAIPWKDRRNCKNCPVVIMCRSGCDIMNDEDSEIACPNLKLWNFGLLMCCWKILFNSYITKIESI